MIAETMISGSSFSSAITITKSSGTKLTFLTSNKFVDRNMELEINAQSASLDLAGGGLINESLSFGGTGLSFTSLSSSGSIRYVGPLTVTASAFKEAVTVNSDINGWVNAASGAQVVAADSMALSSNAYLSGATFGSSQGMIITSPDILNDGYTVETLAITDGSGEFQFDIADERAFISQIKDNNLSEVWHPAWKSITIAGAFYSNSVITTASLPACRTIGTAAFNTCANLANINFPVCSNIGNAAFTGCTSLTEANFPACTYIGNSAFTWCSNISNISFPACTSIDNGAFAGCSSLTEADFHVCTSIGNDAFTGCTSLTEANFPVCTNIGSSAFMGCTSLTSVSFPACTSIGINVFGYCAFSEIYLPSCTYIRNGAFSPCFYLRSLYLLGPSVCTLEGEGVFAGSPISGYTQYTGGVYGSIFVPPSLYSQYISAPNWSKFSNRIVPYGAFESATGVSF